MSIAGGSAVWYLMRGSGVVSLLLLTAVMALGVATVGGVRLGSMPRFATLALHRSVSLLAVAFLGRARRPPPSSTPTRPSGVVDVVVPFGAASQPLAVGLGAVALDLVLALVVTGVLRARIGRRAWRAIHWSAYAAWPLAWLHALALGSDAGTPWMRGVADRVVLRRRPRPPCGGRRARRPSPGRSTGGERARHPGGATADRSRRLPPVGLPRLLADPHRAPSPAPGPWLIDEVERSGLRGRGGAGLSDRRASSRRSPAGAAARSSSPTAPRASRRAARTRRC